MTDTCDAHGMQVPQFSGALRVMAVAYKNDAFGNAEQQQRFLVPLARGEMLGAFCLTEPHVGSDASSLRTTAVKDGDSYVLDGEIFWGQDRLDFLQHQLGAK